MIEKSALFYVDLPDPCVIYAKDAYYMTTTSVHFMPGIPILRSLDLAQWEMVTYVYDTFQDNAAHQMKDGQNIYGSGAWATSLRYHDGWFYVCFNSNDAQNTFVYRTQDLQQGVWEQAVISGFHHDPSLLFDDGKVYMVYGCGTIYIQELAENAMGVKEGGIHQILVETPKVQGLNCEGSHMHKINGQYYLVLIQWPTTGTARRIQWCYRCNTLLGTYEGKVVLDDDLGYKNCGVAQGGLFSSKEGNWYAMLFQDRLPYGRCPVLLPVIWKEGWPVMGEGKGVPMPDKLSAIARMTQSDEFCYTENKLPFVWQWNHNPDNTSWTVTERPGWLRLYHSTLTPCFEQARNMLTQLTEGTTCSFWTKFDTTGLKPGDHAGIAALQYHYGNIGVVYDDGGKRIVMSIGEGINETVMAEKPLLSPVVYLKIQFRFEAGGDIAVFSYADDGETWHGLGVPLHMKFSTAHFCGYRPALFGYATQSVGGYADFDFFRYAPF